MPKATFTDNILCVLRCQLTFGDERSGGTLRMAPLKKTTRKAGGARKASIAPRASLGGKAARLGRYVTNALRG